MRAAPHPASGVMARASSTGVSTQMTSRRVRRRRLQSHDTARDYSMPARTAGSWLGQQRQLAHTSRAMVLDMKHYYKILTPEELEEGRLHQKRVRLATRLMHRALTRVDR